MRMNIEIDGALMREALAATGLKARKDAVEPGLKTLLRLHRQVEIRKYKGRLDWDGDLDDMRSAP